MNTRKNIPGMAALAAAVLLLIPTLSFAQDEDPPSRVARIAYMQGTVSLQAAGADDWSDAPQNYPLIGGDRLYTDQGGRAVIQNGQSNVRMWGQTDVTLTNLTDQYEQIGIAQGEIRVRVYALNPDNTIEVDTPNGAVMIQQPGDYRINAYSDQASLVAVSAGAVQVTGPGVNQEVVQGQAVQLEGTNPLLLGLVETPGFDDLDRWSMDRDRHIMNSISARYVSPDIPGYDDLDDSGTWVSTPDYGPVWYPQGVAAGWQPYTVGHWAYVRPWGYTWVDAASWGYAPFHYGRWAVIEGRWGWLPGPRAVAPVYSPALVAFVGDPGGVSVGISLGGGIGVTAWFPLGVAEPYVPWYHCSPSYVRTVNVTNINTTVIRNTTIINNYNTFITNTRTVSNVDQIRVNNVTYANRQRVYAVPSESFKSGARVQQVAVRLDARQRQRLVAAPVAVARPIAPAPQRPQLQARSSVARPTVRPVLMTPHGRTTATPAANHPSARPVVLPKPQPATAIRPAARPVAPNLRPASPAASRPAAPINNNHPASPINNNHPASPGPGPAAPAVRSAPQPVTQPGPGRPSTQPVRPTPEVKPQVNPTRPAPSVTPVRPAPKPEERPAIPPPPRPQVQPTQPEARPIPPAARPTPRPIPPARPEARPAPPATRPEARPAPQPPARPTPSARPEARPAPPATRPEARPAPRPTPPAPQTRVQQKAAPKGQKPEQKKPEDKEPQ